MTAAASRRKEADLGEAVAKALASFFVVAEASVVDVYGRAGSASVGLGEGNVTAYLLKVPRSSLHTFVAAFYSEKFSKHMLSAVEAAVGAGGLSIAPEDAQPEAFEPLAEGSTTEATTEAPTSPEPTSTSGPAVAPATAQEVEEPATPRPEDVPAGQEAPDEYLSVAEPPAGSGRRGPIAWPWFVIGGGVAGLVISLCVVMSRRRAHADAARERTLREKEEQQRGGGEPSAPGRMIISV